MKDFYPFLTFLFFQNAKLCILSAGIFSVFNTQLQAQLPACIATKDVVPVNDFADTEALTSSFYHKHETILSYRILSANFLERRKFNVIPRQQN